MPDKNLLLLGIQGGPRYLDALEGAWQLGGSSTPEDLDKLWSAEYSGSQLVVINFESTADGRAFSLARHLRLRLGYQGTLYAAGEIIPDQVRMALDCGCDAVVINAAQRHRYGEENWLHSPGKRGHLSYWSHGRMAENRAWEKRTVVEGSPVHL